MGNCYRLFCSGFTYHLPLHVVESLSMLQMAARELVEMTPHYFVFSVILYPSLLTCGIKEVSKCIGKNSKLK